MDPYHGYPSRWLQHTDVHFSYQHITFIYNDNWNGELLADVVHHWIEKLCQKRISYVSTINESLVTFMTFLTHYIILTLGWSPTPHESMPVMWGITSRGVYHGNHGKSFIRHDSWPIWAYPCDFMDTPNGWFHLRIGKYRQDANIVPGLSTDNNATLHVLWVNNSTNEAWSRQKLVRTVLSVSIWRHQKHHATVQFHLYCLRFIWYIKNTQSFLPMWIIWPWNKCHGILTLYISILKWPPQSVLDFRRRCHKQPIPCPSHGHLI